MARFWSPAAEARLRELYAEAPWATLCFQLKRSRNAITQRAGKLGLQRRRFWTAVELRVLRKRFPHERTANIAKDLGRGTSQVSQCAAKLGLKKSAKYLATGACRFNGHEPASKVHRFKKGQVPANKGVKRPGWAPGRMGETQFKKGARPQTWVPIGTRSRDRDGYWKEKVRDDAPPGMSRFNWVYMHVALWVEHLGPVPPGHCIKFKNGNQSDIRIDNLACISKRQRMLENTIHRYPPEVKEVMQLVGRVKRAARKRNQHEEQDRGSAESPVRRARGPARSKGAIQPGADPRGR